MFSEKQQYERFILLEEADILRQSSIDLTLFTPYARTYVVTNDKQYRDNYHRIFPRLSVMVRSNGRWVMGLSIGI